MSHLPTGDVTFLFSDMEGSTRLWERFPETMPAVLARHDALFSEAVAAGGGDIFKRGGDSFCIAFPHPVAAVTAGLAVQRGLHRESWPLPEGHTPRVRIALHTGKADQRDGDYFGLALSQTARLLAAAHGGQTLVSESAAAVLSVSLPEEAGLISQGRHRLKDLAQPQEIFQLIHPDLPAEFPPLRSLESFTHNLPGQLTSFIGREEEMATARRLLQETRLLTLTGTGGTGKSRLALQVAADLLGEYPDGVWLVELAPLSDPALLPQAIAAVLGAGEEPPRPLRETLTDLLRPKELLLILDNCEHLIEASARLSENLLRACPRLQILATSREALEIGGESTLPVPSLTTPASGLTLESLARFECVRLFVDRATSALPTFRLSAGNAPAVAQVCARLDGIPLALELAAARVTVLTPEQISSRLDNRFQLLSGGSRTALPRQQTLRALIDWSYDLLLPAEQALLRRLSVFAGGWSLEAAETVCVDGEGRDVLDLLSRLVAKSLVVVEPPEAGQVRYHLQENLRQYARDRLAQTDEEPRLAHSHQAFFSTFAEEAARQLKGPDQVLWLNQLERDHDNFRAALKHCGAGPEPKEPCLRLANALYRFWFVRGYLSEGLQYLESALDCPGSASDDLLAKANTAAGVLTWSLGDTTKSRTFHEASLHLNRQNHDQVGIARSLANLGIVASHENQLSRARDFFEESLALYHQAGTQNDVAVMMHNLGSLLIDYQEWEEARSYLEEGLQLARKLQDEKLITSALYSLGCLAENLKRFPVALEYFVESLLGQIDYGEKQAIALTLRAIARVGGFCGRYDTQVILLGAEAAYAEHNSIPSLDTDKAGEHTQCLQAACTALGEGEYQRLWKQGRLLTLEQATEFAVEQSKLLTAH